jgi:hypothetical protein
MEVAGLTCNRETGNGYKTITAYYSIPQHYLEMVSRLLLPHRELGNKVTHRAPIIQKTTMYQGDDLFPLKMCQFVV